MVPVQFYFLWVPASISSKELAQRVWADNTCQLQGMQHWVTAAQLQCLSIRQLLIFVQAPPLLHRQRLTPELPLQGMCSSNIKHMSNKDSSSISTGSASFKVSAEYHIYFVSLDKQRKLPHQPPNIFVKTPQSFGKQKDKMQEDHEQISWGRHRPALFSSVVSFTANKM